MVGQNRSAKRIKHGTLHFLRVLWALDLRWKDYEMRKGFTRKPKADEPATQGKNYITPSGLQRLHDEHRFLLSRERPAVTEVVAWDWNYSTSAGFIRAEMCIYEYMTIAGPAIQTRGHT